MIIKKRDLIFIFTMTIITFGIYYIYWTVKTKNEIKRLGAAIPTAFLMIIPIINIYFFYKYSVGFARFVKHLSEADQLSYVIMLTTLFVVIPIVAMLVVQYELNKITPHS